MSTNSQDEPWHRAYRRQLWYSSPVKFPEGRNPLVDLFSNDGILALQKAISARSTLGKEKLQVDLRELAMDYMIAALVTPLRIRGAAKNETLSKRSRWLSRNVRAPVLHLITQFEQPNNPWLSEWPDPMHAQGPDKHKLLGQLRSTLDWVEELIVVLDDRIELDIDHTTEFRLDLSKALENVFRIHFPTLPVSRGTADKYLQEMVGPFPEFLRVCVKEIFPEENAFSDYVIAHTAKKLKNKK
jgi:hypothetical protein